MATDREYLKMQQAGQLATSGATSPISAVGEAHEHTFVFSNAAGAALAEVGMYIPKKARVKSVKAVPGATLATDATNYVTGTVAKRDGAGGAATTIASYTTNSSGGAALTAFTATDCAIVAGTSELAAGSILTYKLVDAATTTEVATFVSVTVEWV